MHISKNHFDKAYNAKMEKLKKVTPESNYLESEFFQQTSFTKAEINWHFRSTLILSFAMFYLIGFKLQVLVFCIKYLPFPLVGLLGHGPKCIFMCFSMMISSVLTALYVKKILYKLIALYYGF